MHPPVTETSASDKQFPAPMPGRTLKTAIPERYIKPWEFKLTRDEVLYDMNVTATFTNGPAP